MDRLKLKKIEKKGLQLIFNELKKRNSFHLIFKIQVDYEIFLTYLLNGFL